MSNEDNGPCRGLEAFRGLGPFAWIGGFSRFHLPRITGTVNVMNESLQRAFSGVDFLRLAEMFAEAPDRHRRIQPYLTERSWCLPESVSLEAAKELEDLIEANEHEAVEQYLVEYMKATYDYMEDFILDQNPKRKEILAQAFEAHEAGLYAASIPLMLIHGEGISKELFGTNVFVNGKGGLEALKKDFEAVLEEHEGKVETDSIAYILFEPLTSLIGLRSGSWEIDNPPRGVETKHVLSRHAVIHTKDLDYDTEANGLRCVALLMLLSEAKEMLERGDDSSNGDEQQ